MHLDRASAEGMSMLVSRFIHASVGGARVHLWCWGLCNAVQHSRFASTRSVVLFLAVRNLAMSMPIVPFFVSSPSTYTVGPGHLCCLGVCVHAVQHSCFTYTRRLVRAGHPGGCDVHVDSSFRCLLRVQARKLWGEPRSSIRPVVVTCGTYLLLRFPC